MGTTKAKLTISKASHGPPRSRSSHDRELDLVSGMLRRTLVDLPERYGPWSSVYSRFRRWKKDGILDGVLA